MYDQRIPVTHHFYPLQKHTSDTPEYGALERVMARQKRGSTDNMIYVHLPYCEQQCLFCPFHVRVDRHEDAYPRYIDTVIAEMDLVAQRPYVRGMDFTAVYIGGGSPSVFPLVDLKRLFKALRERFSIHPDAEWTLEGEPKSLNDEALMDWLAEEKVRRVSYGIQTFDEDLRKRMNIAASVEDVLGTLELAKARGIAEVNIDMMYHMPGQDIAAVQSDIDRVGAHPFDSVDYYYMSYFAMPKKILENMERGTFPARPAEDLRPRMDHHIRQALTQMGYHHVTDHVFSRRPKSSDYYRILWGGGFGEWRAETLALGCSARGYLDGISYSLETDPARYGAMVADGKLPVLKVSDRLNRPENRGLVFFPKFFSIPKDAPALTESDRMFFARLIENGLMDDDGVDFRLTDKGKDWIPNITMDLFEPAQQDIAMGWLETLASNYRNRVSL